MRILRYTLFLFAIGLISCEQEFDKKEQQSDCCSFQNLPKYPEQVVNINVHNYIPDMGDKVLSLLHISIQELQKSFLRHYGIMGLVKQFMHRQMSR